MKLDQADRPRVRGGLMFPKPRVYRDPANSRHWAAWCPCGFTWHTQWWRLALRLALVHEHKQAAS